MKHKMSTRGLSSTTRPLPFAFGLLSGLLALAVMRAVDVPELDVTAYRAGGGLAGGLGALTGWLVVRLRERGVYGRFSGWLVPLAGSLVGVTVQALVLVDGADDDFSFGGVEISALRSVTWVLCGIPVGALAALVVWGVLAFVPRLLSTPSHDSAERLATPFAVGTALVGSLGLATASRMELPIVMGSTAVALAALVHIVLSDLARARWLRSVFSGEIRGFEVVPFKTFPSDKKGTSVVGGVVPRSVIVWSEGNLSGYRAAAKSVFATTGVDLNRATAPLRLRGVGIAMTVVATVAMGVLSLASR